MTQRKTHAPRRAALPAAAIAGLLLAGCSSGHVGESWQCPLAEGGACDSVAAADPAVPDPKAAAMTVLAEPLWRVRPTELAPESSPPARGPGQALETVRSCERACDAFDPFGWLVRLIGSGGDGGEGHVGPAAGEAGPARTDTAPEPVVSSTAPTGTEPRPATALLPAEPGPAQDHPDASDDLRTGEVVARIWIAPFVDADGVYREASHVRVVLEPAAWRLP